MGKVTCAWSSKALLIWLQSLGNFQVSIQLRKLENIGKAGEVYFLSRIWRLAALSELLGCLHDSP